MRHLISRALLPGIVWAAVAALALANPDETVRLSSQVLSEIMAIPGKQIPERLLADAQGVAIIPNVIKIGFVAGGRRGHGVVLVRDNDGEWSLPQFVTLTGGSVGWQAGIQSSDIVLVFTTKQSVQGLMQGKFTIGADASAAAGPVGRNAAAATDAELKAEILSYSRSRGLFLGVSVDGSAIEIDNEAHALFYGSNTSELPRAIPQSAVVLRQQLVDLTPVELTAAGTGQALVVPAERANEKLDALRRSLAQNAVRLQPLLTPQWQQYLALPKGVFEGPEHPRIETLTAALQQYDRVAKAPQYARLVERPEFQVTYELLREYARMLAAVAQPAMQLPPPPAVAR